MREEDGGMKREGALVSFSGLKTALVFFPTALIFGSFFNQEKMKKVYQKEAK
ncbi:MAG: hypothetical protein RI564_09990 [Gracilimonas sp.]|nr:hypothetical protein [Gracilimonas sp.]